MGTFAQRWEAVWDRISLATWRSGRDPEDITVVAVTKTRTAAEVEEAGQAGILLVGENRVQEAEAKKSQVRVPVQWHLVGHLQSNKAAKAVELFDMVQSVDTLKIAQALERRADQAGRTVDILVQVNTSGAIQQAGIAPEKTASLVEQVTAMRHLRLRGLMTIGLLSDEETAVRACFARLRGLRDELLDAIGSDLNLEYLSMGMSGDFEWAIAEGANMLRLGTVLFGPRAG